MSRSLCERSIVLQHIKDMNVENCLAHKEFEMEWPEARFMLVEENWRPFLLLCSAL